MGNCLFGLRSFSSDQVEVRELLTALSAPLSSNSEPLNTQAVSTAVYGLQGLSSDHAEVRQFLRIILPQIASCTAPYDAQTVGNALYGLQSLTSDHDEVRQLVHVLTANLPSCQDILSPQLIGNALFGLQGLHSSHAGIHELVQALTPLLLTSVKAGVVLKPQNASNALYGLRNISVHTITHFSTLITSHLLPPLQALCNDSSPHCPQVAASATFHDLCTAYQTLSIICDSPQSALWNSLRILKLTPSFITLKDRLHQQVTLALSTRPPEPFASAKEEVFARIAKVAFANYPAVTLTTNEWLHGFEADLVFRLSPLLEGSAATAASSLSSTIIVNIELDGPSHRSSGSPKLFESLRDKCLLQHGVHVERWNLLAMRRLSQEEIVAKFHSTVSTYGSLGTSIALWVQT